MICFMHAQDYECIFCLNDVLLVIFRDYPTIDITDEMSRGSFGSTWNAKSDLNTKRFGFIVIRFFYLFFWYKQTAYA